MPSSPCCPILAEVDSVRQWFGAAFNRLDPLLQSLHRSGARLSGEVEVSFGAGIAYWLGKILARRFGIPVTAGMHRFTVEISPCSNGVQWIRRFADGGQLRSHFIPVGQWPTGYWLEESGAIRMRLTVDIEDGGWHWRWLAIQIGALRVPRCLFANFLAYKRIENGRYRFHVAFVLPWFGRVLAYSGLLAADLGSDLTAQTG